MAGGDPTRTACGNVRYDDKHYQIFMTSLLIKCLYYDVFLSEILSEFRCRYRDQIFVLLATK